ncbi:MAG: hypothetical protein L6W00_23425 [Lentisphaeria bacterium]|nr:MAG: hypothetical protein L6W00_23425 [Lentisphaeria bacterium]
MSRSGSSTARSPPFHAPVTWNTELFYLRQADYRDHYTSSLFEAHHAATRFLTDLGEGVTQSCPVHIDSVWKKTIHERFRAFVSLNGTDGTFSAIGVAYNPLARFFEGAKPVDKIRYPNGVICYVFTRDGREIAALWNYASRRDLSADLSAFEVMDLFGNPIPEAKALHLSAAPYYLRPKNGEKSFGTLLKKLEIRMDQLIQVQRAARLITDQSGRSILRVTLFNTGNREVKCSASLGGRLVCPEGIRSFSIAAGKSFTLDLPCNVKGAAGEAFLGLVADGKSRRIPLEVTENPAAGAGSEQSFRSKDGKLDASFRIERKARKVELVIRVRDTTDSGAASNGRALWEQDCVELFFRPESRSLRTGTPRKVHPGCLPAVHSAPLEDEPGSFHGSSGPNDRDRPALHRGDDCGGIHGQAESPGLPASGGRKRAGVRNQSGRCGKCLRQTGA